MKITNINQAQKVGRDLLTHEFYQFDFTPETFPAFLDSLFLRYVPMRVVVYEYLYDGVPEKPTALIRLLMGDTVYLHLEDDWFYSVYLVQIRRQPFIISTTNYINIKKHQTCDTEDTLVGAAAAADAAAASHSAE